MDSEGRNTEKIQVEKKREKKYGREIKPGALSTGKNLFTGNFYSCHKSFYDK